MRRIEREMLQAIRYGRNWSSGNTTVEITGLGAGRVLLHGHVIATFADCGGMMYPNRETLEDWPTATTISRLRALGVDAHRRDNYVWIGDAMIAPARGGRPR